MYVHLQNIYYLKWINKQLLVFRWAARARIGRRACDSVRIIQYNIINKLTFAVGRRHTY